MKDSCVEDLLSAKYYSLLTGGSTDGSILEQEGFYVLFLSKKGEPGGLGVKMKESAPWINVIHCFNHSLDIFDKTFFK